MTKWLVPGQICAKMCECIKIISKQKWKPIIKMQILTKSRNVHHPYIVLGGEACSIAVVESLATPIYCDPLGGGTSPKMSGHSVRTGQHRLRKGKFWSKFWSTTRQTPTPPPEDNASAYFRALQGLHPTWGLSNSAGQGCCSSVNWGSNSVSGVIRS